MKKQTFTLTYPWDESWDKNGYKPEVVFELGMNEEGFTMHINVQESNPRREQTEHLAFVHEDSCVEMEIQSRELVVEMKREDVEETGSPVLSQENVN